MIRQTVEIQGAKLELNVFDDHRVRPMIVICPGGGYEHVSLREGRPVSDRFNELGFNTAVLTYSVGPEAVFPTALIQLAYSVAFIRKNAEALSTDPDKICTMGFSAGGHLTACLGCFWPEYGYKAQVNAQILCYPVITSGKYAHKASFENLCRGNEDFVRQLSLEKMVRSCVPPTFIWHTKTDESVPVENSILFEKALTKENIVHEMKLFETGVHGLSLANEKVLNDKITEPNREVMVWPELAASFLNRIWA